MPAHKACGPHHLSTTKIKLKCYFIRIDKKMLMKFIFKHCLIQSSFSRRKKGQPRSHKTWLTSFERKLPHWLRGGHCTAPHYHNYRSCPAVPRNKTKTCSQLLYLYCNQLNIKIFGVYRSVESQRRINDALPEVIGEVFFVGATSGCRIAKLLQSFVTDTTSRNPLNFLV